MILAVIPARMGSKGMPYKNFLECDGVSLWQRAADIALAMGMDVVITTDCKQSLEDLPGGIRIKVTNGAYLHSDVCKSLDVWEDAWDKDRYQTSILLEPTCPTRTIEDIERCLAMLDRFSSVATVSEATPKEKLFKVTEKGIQTDNHIPRRQDCKKYYKVNGACYAMRADHKGEILDDAGAVVLDAPRISIDTYSDLWLSELIIQSVESHLAKSTCTGSS